jgi:magnesium-transporting ATPase (P-type)
MARPGYTPEQWHRAVRALIVVSAVNGVIVSLLVPWLMGRIELLPTLIRVIAFGVATIPPSLWLLRRHLETDSRAHAGRLVRRNHR